MDEVINKKPKSQDIALPNELPKSHDLSHLPDHVLRSNAVETLVQQNEELMSRLSVSLRRLSHLENLQDEQDSKVKKFKHHYEVLKDEVFILKEKADRATQEAKNKNKSYLDILAKHKAIDFEYTKLFQDHQSLKQSSIEKINKLSMRLKSLIKYKNNISPLIMTLKQSYNNTKHLNSEFKGENKVLKGKLLSLTSYIQDQANSFSDEKENLLKQFDEDSNRINKLEKQLENHKQNIEAKDNELVNLKNYKISSERKHQSKIDELQLAINDQNKERSDYRTELKRLKIENLDLKTQVNDISEHIAFSTQEQNELKEQLENTQMFFASLQKKFEKEQAKTSSLQKINRRLSQEMNTYRSTIQSLKDLRDKNILTNSSSDESNKATIDKIENLIFEIERDFR